MIEHAVHLFLTQWFSGLQPSLYINTHSNGEVFVCSKVKGCIQQPPLSFPSLRRRRRSSGQQSRQKRKIKRSQAREECNAVYQAEENLEDDEKREQGNLPLTFNNSNALIEPDFDMPTGYVPVYDDAAVQTVSPSADVASQATPDLADIHCRSCEVEFSTWNDYLKHRKSFSFMCSNCLDYFAEKPWFRISDLIFIDVEGGVQIYQKNTVLDLTQFDHSYAGTT